MMISKLTLVGLLLFAAMFGGVLSGLTISRLSHADQIPKVVEAREFVLKDAFGKVRGKLSINLSDETVLSLNGDDGEKGIVLATGTQKSSITVSDGQGTFGLKASVNSKDKWSELRFWGDKTYMGMFGMDGRKKIQIWGTETESMLMLYSPKFKHDMSFTSDDFSNEINFSYKGGRILTLGSNKFEPIFSWDGDGIMVRSESIIPFLKKIGRKAPRIDPNDWKD